jgi:lipopolysaccharide export system protein LptA
MRIHKLSINMEQQRRLYHYTGNVQVPQGHNKSNLFNGNITCVQNNHLNMIKRYIDLYVLTSIYTMCTAKLLITVKCEAL